MIIGVNGYALSGKDTVGQLIQQLDPDGSWEIKKFAGKLKTIASILTNIPVENFEDQQFKKLELDPMWSDHGIPMTVRDFLQKLGTDGLRNGLHPNTWVNALMADYVAEKLCDCKKECRCIFKYPNWIITDCRFPNEAYAIKNAGGIIIRIDRPGITAINDHPSEVALDKWEFNYRISNDGTINKLKNEVEKILINEKTIAYA